jgi:CRISPR system Cascade subunit CasA
LARTIGLLCVGALALAGCISYRAAPLDSAGVASSVANRRLDVEKTRAELARIAPGAQWDGAHWDRLSLLAFALATNPSITEARAHATSAARSAKAARMPPPATVTLTAEYANDPSTSSPWLYGVTSDIPLDIGGDRTLRVGAADFAAKAARYDYSEAIWTVRMALRRALAARLLAEHEVALTAELADVRALELAAAERRAAAGETSRLDLERIRADVAADARKQADAGAHLIAANAALAQALGVSVDALNGIQFSWDDFDASASDLSTLGEAKASALLDRPDILRAVAGYDQAESDLRGEVARQFPQIHFGPGYTWERGLVKIPFSLGLVLPPLDLNRNAISAAESKRAAAGAHLETVVAAAQGLIASTIAEQAAAQKSLVRARDVELPAALAAARSADIALRVGEIDRVDWGASKASALSARLTALEALRRAQEANAVLEDALRRPLDGPERAVRTAVTEGKS